MVAKVMQQSILVFVLLGLTIVGGASVFAGFQASEYGPPAGRWELVFEDMFAGDDLRWDQWQSQAGPSGHILSSRWPENVVVQNDMLSLVNRKERRGGQDWTSGNIWTIPTFQYGYFEARYRYSNAPGVNNSFWIMTRPNYRVGEGAFEIDINEGHYPNIINTNFHYMDQNDRHVSASRRYTTQFHHGQEFHVYGLLWTERELVYFFNGQEIRRVDNTFAHRPAPVWLSGAIMNWAGQISDAIDGTSMDVDYVRVWQQAPGEFSLQYPTDGATKLPAHELQLSWSPADSAQLYRVQIAPDPQFQSLVVDEILDGLEIEIASLQHGTKYYWRVGASLSSAGAQDWSVWNTGGPRTFSTQPVDEPPDGPPLLSIDEALGTVTLTWQSQVLADTYAVYRKESGQEDYHRIAVGIARDRPFFTDRTVSPGKEYSYRLQAENSAGASPLSSSALVFVRPVDAFFIPDFASPPENVRLQGAWSGNGSAALLRATSPPALGSLLVSGLGAQEYNVEYSLRLLSFGDMQDLAAVRLGFSISGRERYQLIYWHGTATMDLDKRTTSGRTQLASAPLRLQTGVWYRINVRVVGQSIQISINDELVFDATDMDPLIGEQLELFATNCDIELKDVSVYWSY